MATLWPFWFFKTLTALSWYHFNWSWSFPVQICDFFFTFHVKFFKRTSLYAILHRNVQCKNTSSARKQLVGHVWDLPRELSFPLFPATYSQWVGKFKRVHYSIKPPVWSRRFVAKFVWIQFGLVGWRSSASLQPTRQTGFRQIWRLAADQTGGLIE